METLEIESIEIVNMIKNNPFEKGIILGGLEWSNQPEELVELINLAKTNGLEVMVYTGLNEDEFYNVVNKSMIPNGIYIKFGRYIEHMDKRVNIQYGIKLASDNQYIKLI